MLTAAILAGGRARRMSGRDKGALRVGGRSILDRELAVIHAVTPHIVIIGGAADAGTRGGYPVVPDRVPDAGALGGLYTALLESKGDQVLVVACDMPFLTVPFLTHLARVGGGADAAVPRDHRSRHPLCASYAPRVAARLKQRIDAGRLSVIDALSDLDVLEIGPDEIAPFDPDGTLLSNVNTLDDYEQALTSAGPRRS